jgi:hypothetical protein
MNQTKKSYISLITCEKITKIVVHAPFARQNLNYSLYASIKNYQAGNKQGYSIS